MKRVWREALLGAVSCVATVGPVGGVLLIPSEANAQDAAAPAPASPAAAASVVRRIVVSGNQRVEASTVLSYVPIQPGDALNPAAVDAAIKTLFATGLFGDVDINDNNGILTIQVVENPIINRVIFEGVRALKEEDLTKEVQAKPRSVFTAARAQADIQRIVELYRRSGRFAASVTPSVRELEQNRVDLIFTVSEGPTTGVKSINFIGNAAFSDTALRKAVVTEQSKWWKFLTSNDNYDPDRLDYDRELLRQWYTNRGYADFRVVSGVAELTPDQKDFFVTFTIEEGIQYDFGEIVVETELDRLSPKLLKASIPIRSGRRFQGKQIESAIDAMTFVAGASGYANVDIRPRVDRDKETRKVNITFEVNEGPRIFVDRIEVAGNNSTLDEVIRRELRVVEGDAFNRILLDRSKARLRGLGFFKTVEIEEKPGGDADRSVVDVKVEEDSTGELSFQAGYSSTENFLFDVSISQSNLGGRGQFLRLRASTSSRRQQLDLQFTEPKFLGRNLAAGFNAFLTRSNFLDVSAFATQTVGGLLRASFPLTERSGLGLTYSLRQDTINIADSQVGLADGTVVDQCSVLNPLRPGLCDQEGSFVTSIIGFSLSYDRRNDFVTPTKGYNIVFQTNVAGLGGQVQYIRAELEGGIYQKLFGPVRGAFLFSGGYILGYGGDDVRINDRFFKGGSSFRGFEIAGVGPRQLIGVVAPDGSTDTLERDALGANIFGIGTVQAEFPLGLPKEFGLSGAAFYEFGTVGKLDDSSSRTLPSFTDVNGLINTPFVGDQLSFRASAGISIFWDSPFGPVQFDFAQVLNRQSYDRPEFFRFSTRTRF